MKKYKLGVEIGAGDRYSSELLDRKEEFEEIHLIEPNKALYESFYHVGTHFDNIRVFNFAVSNYSSIEGMGCSDEAFYNFGYCSFLRCASSFLKLSCEDNATEYWRPLLQMVKCKRMNEIDKGNIDYLVLTCNGSEMFVLDDMKSRPSIIRTKYYCHNAKHWQYYNQVSAWMDNNGYKGKILDRSQYSTYYHLEFQKQTNN